MARPRHQLSKARSMSSTPMMGRSITSLPPLLLGVRLDEGCCCEGGCTHGQGEEEQKHEEEEAEEEAAVSSTVVVIVVVTLLRLLPHDDTSRPHGP